MKTGITKKQATFLLMGVITARATGYLFSKLCLEVMGAFTLLALRSILACVMMLPFVFRKLGKLKRHDVIAGGILGVLFFFTMAAEFIGLKTTESSIAAILENTAIIMVPLIVAIISRKLPDLKVLVCCVMALSGIIFMSLEGASLSLSVGEWITLLAAFFYAISIICTAKFAKESDPVMLGFLEVTVMGILALVAAFIFESPTIVFSADIWGSIAYLSVVCTCFGFTLQPLAQSRCSAEKAAVFCALNPLVAAVIGVLVLGEAFDMGDMAGLVLVLLSIVVYGKDSTDVPKDSAATT